MRVQQYKYSNASTTTIVQKGACRMQQRGEAIGIIETVGMVPAIYGADFMLKAADVQLVSYENVGSTLVTVIVQGDIAACRTAVEAGAKAAAAVGKLTASNVIPRPIQAVTQIVAVHGVVEHTADETETQEVMG